MPRGKPLGLYEASGQVVLHNDDYLQGFVATAGIERRQDCNFGCVFGIRSFGRSHQPVFLRPQERAFSLFKTSLHPHYPQIGWVDGGNATCVLPQLLSERTLG
jgi:hypothetical protein